jgi:SWI/SNF-related matrix-associated actin-dependent regulator of chromatin subfamily A3
VHVYQLVAENTVESKVLDIQERKKTMIQQAFSGIKSNETQRQKKEARLQGIRYMILLFEILTLACVDLIQLFGLRQQVAEQVQE